MACIGNGLTWTVEGWGEDVAEDAALGVTPNTFLFDFVGAETRNPLSTMHSVVLLLLEVVAAG